MPKISITPVKFVDISICVVDLPTLEQKAILMTLIDEITTSLVPSRFVDPCQLDRHHEWIEVLERISSDQAGDFVQKIGQAYDLVLASKV